jgi:hypothetical protein
MTTTTAYLYQSRHHLGPWLKLRMRADNLPLFCTLDSHASSLVPSRSRKLHSPLCSSRHPETLTYFLLVCPALDPERAAFTVRLRAPLNNIRIFFQAFMQ